MPGSRYGAIAFSAPVAERQRAAGSITSYGRLRPAEGADGEADTLNPRVTALIKATDSFAIATVTPDGWPYLQHRGGPPGFIDVPDPSTIVFPDYPGNQQYVTLGNLDENDRVALLFIDYPTRTRVKVFGRARIVDRIVERARERTIVVTVEALDMNCRKNIPVKYGEESIRERLRLLQADSDERIEALTRRIAELETPTTS
jgi:uncharacterized protein